MKYDNGDGDLDDDEMAGLLREVSGAPAEVITEADIQRIRCASNEGQRESSGLRIFCK